MCSHLLVHLQCLIRAKYDSSGLFAILFVLLFVGTLNVTQENHLDECDASYNNSQTYGRDLGCANNWLLEYWFLLYRHMKT